MSVNAESRTRNDREALEAEAQDAVEYLLLVVKPGGIEVMSNAVLSAIVNAADTAHAALVPVWKARAEAT
jgi:hypothetical protein